MKEKRCKTNKKSWGISISDRELLLQRFREIHAYLHLLGEHINYIYNRVQEIESDINTRRKELRTSIEASRNELKHIKETIVTKSEVDNLLRELNEIIKGVFPLLPTISATQLEKE